jgi:3-hydroxyacyl-[acyl-carrier-protein] dehydratase
MARNATHAAEHTAFAYFGTGVLMIEAMAQTSGILSYTVIADEYPDLEGDALKEAVSDRLFVLASADGFKFRKPVIPGDQLVITSELLANRRGMHKFECKAEVDGKVVTSGTLMCAEMRIS